MRGQLVLIGTLALGLGCRAAREEGVALSEVPAPPTPKTIEVPDGVLAPDQIHEILEHSARVYRVRIDQRVVARSVTSLAMGASEPEMPPRLDPFLEVERGEDGRPHLRSRPPEGKLEAIFGKASEAFARRDYARARDLYARAIEVDPTYFKSYTYLGNALFFLGQYVEGEQAFRRAIELNPLDYQAFLFLGDTLALLGHLEQSKDALTWAYMLNQGNGVVEERLRSTLAKVRLSVRGGRLLPPVRIERERPGETTIYLDRDQGEPWYALAACLACWNEEPGCRDRAPVEEDPLRLRMYRECLLNHAASLAAVRDAGEKRLSSSELALLVAVERGYLEAIVFWEVVAPKAPAVMLLLPDAVRQDVVAYIERFVFVSTRLASQGSGAPNRRWASGGGGLSEGASAAR